MLWRRRRGRLMRGMQQGDGTVATAIAAAAGRQVHRVQDPWHIIMIPDAGAKQHADDDGNDPEVRHLLVS